MAEVLVALIKFAPIKSF